MSPVRTVGPVVVNGTSLHVQEAGEGPAILFIHGMCGDADVWNGQLELLGGEFRCVAYDRRGHSRSPLGEGVERSVELHADDAAAMIEILGLAPALVVGSSGGARIGLDVVRRHADLVRGAVLSEPPILSLLADGGAEFREKVGPALRAAATPQDAVDAFFLYVDPEAWGAMSEPRRETYRANHVELFGDLQMPPYAPTTDDLSRIDVPVCLLTGDRSVPIFGEAARAVAGAIPGAELVVLEGATHATYVFRPEAFAQAVRSFASALG